MTNKTVIVTGASKGIGRETGKIFARNNYRVVATYLKDFESISSLADEIKNEGQEISVFQYSSGDSISAKALTDFTLKRYGRIDVLINNAGIAQSKLLTLSSDEDWQRIMDTNLSGVFYLTREVAKNMVANKGGSIVNVSSIYGILGASTESIYSASKAGIIGFSKALAKELAPCDITVNCVAPGAIDTSMNAYLSPSERKELSETIPLGRFGKATEVAEAIYFLSQQRYITGEVLTIDGGLT